MPAVRRVREPLPLAVLPTIAAAILVAGLLGVTATPELADARPANGRTLTGVLTSVHGDDFRTGRQIAPGFVLKGRDGTLTEVTFSRPPSAGLLGREVRLTGELRDGRLVVADGGAPTEVQAAAGSTSYSTGSRRVAVILLNFSNDTSQPYTPDAARGIAFTNQDSVAAYYAVSSWDQLTLTGDVFGWVTIPDTNANCAYASWASAARTAASALGFDPAGYDNVVYAFPQTSCGWAGMAEMPGTSSWLNGPGAMSLRVMAHELGHNFGTHHAGDYTCVEGGVKVPLSRNASSCTTGEYGDPYSVMGDGKHFEHTNFSRGNLGWLASANTATATREGDFVIAPVEQQSATAVTALRVARSSSQYFTLEFRQDDGTPFDYFFPTSVDGVIIRLTAASYATISQTWLVWAHPDDTWCTCRAPLRSGESLTDPLSGITFSVGSVSPSGAAVHVSFGGGATPTVSPTPTASPSPSPDPTVTPTPAPTATPTPTPGPTASPSPTPTAYLSAPGNLRATVQGSRKIALWWTASTGSVPVAGYRVYRDDQLVATVTRLKWTDGLPLSGDPRTYYVVAFSASGVVSGPSPAVTVR